MGYKHLIFKYNACKYDLESSLINSNKPNLSDVHGDQIHMAMDDYSL